MDVAAISGDGALAVMPSVASCRLRLFWGVDLRERLLEKQKQRRG